LTSIGLPVAVVATKIDKMKKTEIDVALATFAKVYGMIREKTCQPILFSSITGHGRQEVWKFIKDAILERGIYQHSFAEEDQKEEQDEKSKSLSSGDAGEVEFFDDYEDEVQEEYFGEEHEEGFY
jgi:hypothetical protein